MQKIVLKIKYYERGSSKSLTKFTSLCFPSKPILFNVQDHKEQKEPETSDQPLIRLQNKFRKAP